MYFPVHSIAEGFHQGERHQKGVSGKHELQADYGELWVCNVNNESSICYPEQKAFQVYKF